jgi:hypothetical protein
MKHLQHTSKISKTLETYACNTSLLLERMEARRRMEFTDVELAGNVEIATPLEKATTGLVEKVTAGLHIVQGGARAVRGVSSVANCASASSIPAS